jgi:hypothetical protein
MNDTVTTSLRLELSPISHHDGFQLARICESSQLLVAHATRAELVVEVRSLIQWGVSLGMSGGSMWAVRRDSGELIGCAVRMPPHGELPPRLWMALEHRCWGAGYALDVGRALREAMRPLGWVGLAESPVPDRPEVLMRTTFAELLRFPHRGTVTHILLGRCRSPTPARAKPVPLTERRGSKA